MELSNEFTVAAPIERAWEVLNDVPLIAPCLPGATLEESDGDEHRGNVKVKVGPMSVQYRGVATFVERDESGRRVVLRGEGRDTRGQGTASALITAVLRPDGDDATAVTVVTDLTVTGRVAQFGRGVMADVSAKLMEQFADRLAEVVAAGPAAPTPEDLSGDLVPDKSAAAPVDEPASAVPNDTDGAPGVAASIPDVGDEPSTTPAVQSAAPGPRPPQREVEAIDLLATAGTPVAKRLVPLLAGGVLLALLLRLLRRR